MSRDKYRKSDKYRNTPKGRATSLLDNAERRSQKKRLAFNLKVEDIIPILERGVCQATGIPFVLQSGQGNHPYAPSIDRKVPELGYIKSNIQVVVVIYNVARNNWGDHVLYEFAKALLSTDPVINGPKESSRNRIGPRGLDLGSTFRA